MYKDLKPVAKEILQKMVAYIIIKLKNPSSPIIFNLITLLITTILIIWIILDLYKSYSSPFGPELLNGLLKIQAEFNFQIMIILSIYIFWLKPVYKRLIIITKNKEKINKLMTNIIKDKLPSEKIRDSLAEYFSTRL